MAASHDPNQKQTWTEQIQAAGQEIWNRTDDLIQQGNVRRLIVRNERGDVLMRVPLNPAIAIGAIVTLVNPVLTALAAIVALLTHLKFEMVRDENGEDS